MRTSSARRISVSVLGCLLARWSKKYLSARSPSWLGITVYNEVKSIVGELSKSFLLLEVGAPNDYRATFVGRFDSNVFAFTKVQKSGPFIGFEVEISTVAIEFKFRNIMPAFLDEYVF